jgi:S1-C subfamily serine protease
MAQQKKGRNQIVYELARANINFASCICSHSRDYLPLRIVLEIRNLNFKYKTNIMLYLMINVSIIIILMVIDVLSIVFPFYECFGLFQGDNFVDHDKTSFSYPMAQIKTAITTKGPLYPLNPTTATSIFPQLFNKVKNSVVQINTKTTIINPLVTINGSPQILGKLGDTGSGFVYDRDGDIVTNYHVINQVDSKSIYVTFLDGNSYPAAIRGKDIHSDLAVLQLDPFIGENLCKI